MALLFFIFLYELSKNTNGEQENKPTSYREYQLKTTRINWDNGGIDQKGSPDNSEDLQNAFGPNSQILQMEKNRENKFSKSSLKEKLENYRRKTYHFQL